MPTAPTNLFVTEILPLYMMRTPQIFRNQSACSEWKWLHSSKVSCSTLLSLIGSEDVRLSQLKVQHVKKASERARQNGVNQRI